MKVIFDLPDGLQQSDLPDLKKAITAWASERIMDDKKPFGFSVRQVRALMVERGTSLSAWCSGHGFNATHVLRAIRGDYDGPKAQLAIRLLKEELGMMLSSPAKVAVRQ